MPVHQPPKAAEYVEALTLLPAQEQALVWGLFADIFRLEAFAINPTDRRWDDGPDADSLRTAFDRVAQVFAGVWRPFGPARTAVRRLANESARFRHQVKFDAMLIGLRLALAAGRVP